MYQSPTAAAPTAGPPPDATLGALARWGTARLAGTMPAGGGSGEREAARDAAVLLAAALGLAQSALFAFAERVAAGEGRERFAGWIARRAAGEPVAYILGRREFWSMELAVTPDVLVPRPETELLVERALALGAVSHASLLDLGTGSGAIALAIARERPGWTVTAVELSPAALAVAGANALAQGLGRIELLLGDWFAPVSGRRFDLVVANPPYIAAGDPALGDPALRHEPRLALTPGPDGLASLRVIANAAPAHLVPGGWLALEHGSSQAAELAEVLVARGFRHVRSRRDLAGHERVTEAEWPGR